MRGLRDRGPDLIWSAALAVASLVGGLAAADLTGESTLAAVVVSLVVAAIGVFALYQGWLDNIRPAYGQHAVPPGSHGPRAGQGPPGGPGYAAGLGAFRPPQDGDPDDQGIAQYDPVQPGLVRVVQQPGGVPWWEEHARLRPGGRVARTAGPRRVDLSQFLGQALIAQCPNCGSFHVDFRNQAEPWAFWCADCRQQWTWQPGDPWPAIAVRPRARGQLHPPRA